MKNTLAVYKQKLQAVYPDLEINEIALNTAGQFSDVVIINDALIFKFPKSAHVAIELYQEVKILRHLQGKLPLAIPDITFLSIQESKNAVDFMGYAMIPGQPLLRERFATINDDTILDNIAQDMAIFLKTLYKLPVSIPGVTFEAVDFRESWVKLFAEFEEKLFSYMRPDAREAIRANFDHALNNKTLWTGDPVLCHGDFGTGNILYADGHITGILDFAFCQPDDPAQEVGSLLSSYGENFLERFFIHYPDLQKFLPRAHFIRSNYALIQALFALRDDNQADFEDGMQNYV